MPSPLQRSQENAFVRSRFIPKRLKRMQTKSASFLCADENKENEPAVCYSETNYVSSSSHESLNEINLEPNIAEVVKYSINLNGSRKSLDDNEEHDDEITKESIPESFHNDTVSEISTLTSHQDFIDQPFTDDPLFGFEFPMIQPARLLEEIEEHLTIKSLKEILQHGFFSVGDYRTRSLLSRVMPLSPDFVEPLLSHTTPNSLNENKLEKEIDRLKVELRVQEMLAEQAQDLIKQCNKTTATYIDAEKMLLLASIKHQSVKQEIEKLLKSSSLNEFDSRSGYLCINDILITIDKASLGQYSSYNFICIAVERENIRASEFVTASSDGEITFYNKLHFLYLRVNFQISIFIYGISNKEHKTSRLSVKPHDLFNFSPSRNNKNSKIDNEISHNFVLISSTDICLKDIAGSNYMYLTTDHKHGQSIRVHVKGDVHLSTLHEGFLSVKSIELLTNEENSENELENHDVGVWDLRWYRLTGLGLQGWNYPFQHEIEPPSDYIFLNQCVSSTVERLDYFVCVRKNTFTFTLRSSDERMRKVYCSTNSVESLNIWCQMINTAVKTLKAWEKNSIEE